MTTATKMRTETLRSFVLSALMGCRDRTSIVGFFANWNSQEFIQIHELDASVEDVDAAFALVQRDVDALSFDCDDYNTGFSDDGYDYTDMFAGIESFFEVALEMTCIAQVGEDDHYSLDLPKIEVDGCSCEPRYWEFLRDDARLKCVTLTETTKFSSEAVYTSYYFVLPSDKSELVRDLQDWAEQGNHMVL